MWDVLHCFTYKKIFTENFLIARNCPRLKVKQAFTANFHAFITELCWKSFSWRS